MCDELEMDVCHILLGKPWQYGTRTLHKGRENTYEFQWMGKKVVLIPLNKKNDEGVNVKKEGNNHLFTTISGKSLLKERKADILGLAVAEKSIDTQDNEVSLEVQTLFDEFTQLKEKPKGLPPLRDIQHHIDLILGDTLPHLPHYGMSPKEYKILRQHIEDLLRKGHIQPSLRSCSTNPIHTQKRWKLEDVRG